MTLRRRGTAAALICVLLVACGCSSSGSSHTPPSRPAGSSTSAGKASPAPAGSSATPGPSAVQHYLDTVNGLCDALLPKVIEVTHGGSLDLPVKDYLAQQPAHARLLVAFDRQLARVSVPPAAKPEARVMAAYIRFANRLDARRLAAAKRGAAAYAEEIRSEASIESDPAIAARNAAGFAASCDAR